LRCHWWPTVPEPPLTFSVFIIVLVFKTTVWLFNRRKRIFKRRFVMDFWWSWIYWWFLLIYKLWLGILQIFNCEKGRFIVIYVENWMDRKKAACGNRTRDLARRSPNNVPLTWNFLGRDCLDVLFNPMVKSWRGRIRNEVFYLHSKLRKCGEDGFLYKDIRLYYYHIIYRIIYRTKDVYYCLVTNQWL